MANLYTHNKFGLMLRDNLREDLKEIAYKYEAEYLIGQQGPDPFYFNTSFIIHKIKLANEIHSKSFIDFLNRNKNLIMNEKIDSPVSAYFLGSICHFILDSKIHPDVNALITSDYSHCDIEYELDRYFLIADDSDPKRFKEYNLIPNTNAICKNIYPLYESYNVSFNDVKNSLSGFRSWKKFFHCESKIKENFLLSLMDLLGVKKDYSGQILRAVPFKESKHSNEVLSDIFYSSLKSAPKLIDNIFNVIFEDDLPAKDFYINYEGEV
ncbi:zinc dependent phospholipase C family protein [Peptoniphilus sp. oral taxon 386]|uniref:zinc dependent phospholipase C family protein n=1 Tax=Peptoniphilus sp. oral taxon 386 TaxID=652713 RepID=UPI0002DFFDDC|nr:zinc dependent phospholipase C family protein [Peptoniphilus sp. oral taxon 386]